MRPAWTNIGSITVLQAALGVTERDSASVIALADTKKVFFRPSAGAKDAEIRFVTSAEGDAWVVEMYAARSANDYYTRMATLTLTGGAQKADAGKVFVDTLVGTNEAWYGVVEYQSTGNFIARYYWLLKGYSFLFIASTIEAGKRLEIHVAEIN